MGLLNKGPDNQTRLCQTEPFEKVAGFLEPEFVGNVKIVGQIVPNSARIS